MSLFSRSVATRRSPSSRVRARVLSARDELIMARFRRSLSSEVVTLRAALVASFKFLRTCRSSLWARSDLLRSSSFTLSSREILLMFSLRIALAFTSRALNSSSALVFSRTPRCASARTICNASRVFFSVAADFSAVSRSCARSWDTRLASANRSLQVLSSFRRSAISFARACAFSDAWIPCSSALVSFLSRSVHCADFSSSLIVTSSRSDVSRWSVSAMDILALFAASSSVCAESTALSCSPRIDLSCETLLARVREACCSLARALSTAKSFCFAP